MAHDDPGVSGEEPARDVGPWEPQPRSDSPLWLSHHLPEDLDRCVVIGGRHVCRRCLVLYPVSAVVAVAVLASGQVASAGVALALVVLPLPAVVDFVAEHLGLIGRSDRRLVAVTVPLGFGLGAGFARYLDRPTDPLFWGVALVYSGVCLASALSGRRQAGGRRS